MSALNLIYKDRITFGIELPLDRDWSEAGQRRARIEGRPFGVPDTSNPAKGVKLAENLGFDAVWLRDAPVHDPSLGDAGQVFDPFPYLGFLAGHTRRIALGTAGSDPAGQDDGQPAPSVGRAVYPWHRVRGPSGGIPADGTGL